MGIQLQNKSFETIPVSPEWCFKNVRSIEQWTHGYHRYPAKFLPNLVKKLIEEYTQPTDIVADFFAGCGTTLIESKIHGRKSIGVDINPIAELITKAKINPILPEELENRFDLLIKKINYFKSGEISISKLHNRIDYWFTPINKGKIAFLYKHILEVRDDQIRIFFLVSLSHILKNCSRWLQTSTKPQIDPNKTIPDPFDAFIVHTMQMIKKNSDFYNELKIKKYLNTECEIKIEDARRTSIASNSIGTIITSPPYVTSYEYADIHQLTGYWFEYITDLQKFRRHFIGTFYSFNKEIKVQCDLGQMIVNKLMTKNGRKGSEVANYFNDLNSVALEMYRVLKIGGNACVVIGNTTFSGIKIKTAEVFAEILESVGFYITKVIKRSIPNKLIPTIRDKKTGRFTKLNDSNSILIYPEEYIIIANKR